MRKPIKRFSKADMLIRIGKAPVGLVELYDESKSVRTSRIQSVSFNDNGDIIRIETLNSIYVQVKP